MVQNASLEFVVLLDLGLDEDVSYLGSRVRKIGNFLPFSFKKIDSK